MGLSLTLFLVFASLSCAMQYPHEISDHFSIRVVLPKSVCKLDRTARHEIYGSFHGERTKTGCGPISENYEKIMVVSSKQL